MKRRVQLAPEVVLDTDVVCDRIAILARTDGGKTYRGLFLFEQMHGAGAQCVAIDLVGKWWSLRLAADGKSPGLDVPVFGGLHGDLPLEATAGALVARVIVERGISAVLDISQFEDVDQKRFVTQFCREFYKQKQRNESPVHLFFEEASTLMPQDKEDGQDPALLAATKKLVRKARNYGVGVTMIDQRPQDVSKKCLNQAEILIVLGTSGTTERKALEAWVRDKHVDASGLDELASLQQGEAFVWIPRRKIFTKVSRVQRSTFDASKTPEFGARRVVRKLTPIDVAVLRDEMAETVARVEAEDPKKLCARIAELEKQLKRAPVPTAAPAPVSVAAAPLFEKGEIERLERAIAKLVLDTEGVERLNSALAYLAKICDREAQARQVVVSSLDNFRTVLVRAKAPATLSVPRPTPRRVTTSTEGNDRFGPLSLQISRPQQRILDALAWYQALGIFFPSRQAVALKLGLRLTGTLSNNFGALKSTGLIGFPATGQLELTAAGAARAEAPGTAPTNSEVQAAVLAAVTEPQAKILRTCLDAYPKVMDREELAALLGLQLTGTFSNNIGVLKAMGAVEFPRKSVVAATALMFPEGA